MHDQIDRVTYVLITPARNEAEFIDNTIQSVIRQTALPSKWVIVNDGSTDDTASIVGRYAATYEWMELVNLPERPSRSFAAKAQAFKAGEERLKGIEYEVIGNLDADVTLDDDHFEFLMDKFKEDSYLGVAGTIFREPGYSSDTDSFEGQTHVSGQCQMFRRQCFEEIGGYFPSRVGGIDWIAVTTARMIGWKTRSFREKSFFHNRIRGTAERGVLASHFMYGKQDYYLGGHPVWQLFRCLYRTAKRPYLLGGIALFGGYLTAALDRTERPVSDELMRFHRKEQMAKLRAILAALSRFKRIDAFEIVPIEQPSRVAAGSETSALPTERIWTALSRFIDWLDHYGEVSYDHQSYFASDLGRSAKAFYYTRPLIGKVAVFPMVFSEAFVPSARWLFWKPQRFPIADAHYAMGFAFLAQVSGQHQYYRKAVHFLEVLQETKCPGYDNHCWGYPFNWETRRGTIRAGTPLITTVPYVYEAFKEVYQIDGDAKWRQIMQSAAQHVLLDYKDFETSGNASSCSYTPFPENSVNVINANAYRAFLLTSASLDFSEQRYWRVAERNLNFVLESQNADGSWYYANDGVRNFVDHFHTCFVLKALAKIEALTGHPGCTKAIERGVSYYTENLFDEKGVPRPFSHAPRLTVYRRESYDYAECINLGILLRGRFPRLDDLLSIALDQILTLWQKPDGSFRSRQLHLGWDNTPMHRWASSQLFRSLCLILYRNTPNSGLECLKPI
ncbi:glycosyltransferase [Candidatus Binatus sp.]|uniref:glycosyltransferase family 2 protein n=1 Tax=Candidatus Binatus sp. TaxID=2811406 RepID=UPI003C4007A6